MKIFSTPCTGYNDGGAPPAMINTHDILETIEMIENENLDIRTITMGISLLNCCDSDIDASCRKIYDKITTRARDLVKVGEDIEREYGIPIIHKRIAVTPVSMLCAVSGGDPVKYALTLEKASQAVGVNFIGGYSALVQKGFSAGDLELIRSIPEALASTEHICSSVNIGSTKAGINMDAVAMMGRTVRAAAEATQDRDCIGCAKLVVFCNAPEDNPFMAGAFHGVGEPDCVINVGVSGPGVVRAALAKNPTGDLSEVADIIKKPPLKSRGWAKWLPVWPQIALAFHLVLSISPWLPRLRSVILWRTFWRKWVLKPVAERARPQRLPCSMMLSKRRYNGFLPRGWAVRRIYPRFRRCWYDSRSAKGRLKNRKVGGYDFCLLRRARHDCRPRRYDS